MTTHQTDARPATLAERLLHLRHFRQPPRYRVITDATQRSDLETYLVELPEPAAGTRPVLVVEVPDLRGRQCGQNHSVSEHFVRTLAHEAAERKQSVTRVFAETVQEYGVELLVVTGIDRLLTRKKRQPVGWISAFQRMLLVAGVPVVLVGDAEDVATVVQADVKLYERFEPL